MSKAIQILEAINQPIVKLIEAVSGAIGKAYEPRHTRKMADAKAYELKTIARAVSECPDLRIRYEKGSVSADNEELNRLIQRTQSRIAYQELKKQLNIESVADTAYDLLEGEECSEGCSAEKVDSDWMTRFVNAVEDISDEDLQLLWAKVLAGEVKRPKSFSLRALETLRNLSKDEALLFQKICQYVLDFGDNMLAIPNDEDLLREYEETYSDILLLDECGLVNSSAFVNLSESFQKGVFPVATNHSLVLVGDFSAVNKPQMDITVYPLTAIGCELANVVSVRPNDAFFLSYGRRMKSKSGVPLTMNKILSKTGETYETEEEDLLSE